MPAVTTSHVQNFLGQFERFPRPLHLRILLRKAAQTLRPTRPPQVFEATVTRRQDELLSEGKAEARQKVTVLHHYRRGHVPTIVIGGFVPDATESVFLLQDQLLRHGSVYFVNYPRGGFNLELFFAQLDDLVDETQLYRNTPPVIFAVSFGAGLVIEWLRRRRMTGGYHSLAGLVLVSPVACVGDLIAEGGKKPQTLLGRALQPFLDETKPVDEKVIERSRTIFAKMFEAGAQNKAALKALMHEHEVQSLRDKVLGNIRSIDFRGASERVQSLRRFFSPSSYFSPSILPLVEAPTLILYAEKEDSVVEASSPTRFAFETAHRAYFPRSSFHVVRNPGGAAVQHASLIFHHANFRPFLGKFYSHLRGGWFKQAA